MNRQQDVDKHAKIAMAIISGIIIFLFIIAISGCHNHTHQYEDTYIPRNTTQHKDSTMIYLGDSCATKDSIMNEMKMNCGE